MVKNGVVRAFLYNVSHSAQRHRHKPLEISENCTCTVRWSTLSCRLQLPDLMNRVYQIFYNYYSIDMCSSPEKLKLSISKQIVVTLWYRAPGYEYVCDCDAVR